MRSEILGLPIDLVDMAQTVDYVEQVVQKPLDKTHQIVTINPEIIVRSEENLIEKEAIRSAELVVADGVGIVWAVSQLTPHRLADRVAGSDLLPTLFSHFGPNLRVFFLGAKPGVAELAAKNSKARWGVEIAGVHDGYFKDERPVLELIRQAQPDLLIAGMGERQDAFLYRNKDQLGAKVAIGVGGMLDVLSGQVRRVPEWAQRLKIEWLVRVATDRKRWGRVPRLWKFVQMVLQAKRARGHNQDS